MSLMHKKEVDAALPPTDESVGFRAAVCMMGSELWNIRDTPLLESHIKNYLSSHPSCICQSPLVGTASVLLPDMFHLGEGASDRIRKDAASFLSQSFRHILFCTCQPGQNGSPLGDCVDANLYGLIKGRIKNRKDTMYHVTEEDADDAFCCLLNQLASK